jgi:hypothetical protein
VLPPRLALCLAPCLALCQQESGHLLEPRVVPDDQDRVARGREALDPVQDLPGVGAVEPFVDLDFTHRRATSEIPSSVSRVRRAGEQRTTSGRISPPPESGSANARAAFLTPRRERPVAVLKVGVGPARLGVAEQVDRLHRGSSSGRDAQGRGDVTRGDGRSFFQYGGAGRCAGRDAGRGAEAARRSRAPAVAPSPARFACRVPDSPVPPHQPEEAQT